MPTQFRFRVRCQPGDPHSVRRSDHHTPVKCRHGAVLLDASHGAERGNPPGHCRRGDKTRKRSARTRMGTTARCWASRQAARTAPWSCSLSALRRRLNAYLGNIARRVQNRPICWLPAEPSVAVANRYTGPAAAAGYTARAPGASASVKKSEGADVEEYDAGGGTWLVVRLGTCPPLPLTSYLMALGATQRPRRVLGGYGKVLGGRVVYSAAAANTRRPRRVLGGCCHPAAATRTPYLLPPTRRPRVLDVVSSQYGGR